jgi:hypothetical protein
MCLGECARAVGDNQGGGLGDGVSLSILDDFRGEWAVGGVCSSYNRGVSHRWCRAICRPRTPSTGGGKGARGKSKNSS